jgi:glycosyltransferase involved in cell wall biosynthesis
MEDKKEKIVVVASNSKHTLKFLSMIKDRFAEILVISSNSIDDYMDKVVVLSGSRLKRVLKFKQLIKKFNPDYIHFQNLSKDKILYSFFISRYKSIITTWGSDILIFPNQNIITEYLTKLSLKNFDRISTNDALEMQIRLRQLSSKKIYPIHFAINNYIQFVSQKDKENIIYSPRSHSDLYNIENIIYSFKKFVDKNPNWTLILSGREDKVNTPKYKTLCQDLDIEQNVYFKGFVSDEENAKLYKKSKIVVSIPSSDAKSVVLMEAISSNCICFVSDVPANREFIVSGINGFIVDKDKIVDFSQYKLIDSDFIDKFNSVVATNYTYNNAKLKFLNLYKDWE